MIVPALKRHQRTVLLIEDDEITRDTLTQILVHEGYLALSAESGHDALGFLRTPLSPIDVVILDIRLPDTSGINLCERIKEMHPEMPVVVCTGEAEPFELDRLRELGIHRYFCKPVGTEELLASVEDSMA